MPQPKTPLLQAGENAERHLGRLLEPSVFQAAGAARGLPPLQKSACLCLIHNPPVFFTTAVACGVLNYLVWTRAGHMSVSLTLPFPFCLTVLCCWRYEYPRMMLKSK